jgi:hypothetical protein
LEGRPLFTLPYPFRYSIANIVKARDSSFSVSHGTKSEFAGTWQFSIKNNEIGFDPLASRKIATLVFKAMFPGPLVAHPAAAFFSMPLDEPVCLPRA